MFTSAQDGTRLLREIRLRQEIRERVYIRVALKPVFTCSRSVIQFLPHPQTHFFNRGLWIELFWIQDAPPQVLICPFIQLHEAALPAWCLGHE